MVLARNLPSRYARREDYRRERIRIRREDLEKRLLVEEYRLSLCVVLLVCRCLDSPSPQVIDVGIGLERIPWLVNGSVTSYIEVGGGSFSTPFDPKKKTAILDTSSINIDILPVFFEISPGYYLLCFYL